MDKDPNIAYNPALSPPEGSELVSLPERYQNLIQTVVQVKEIVDTTPESEQSYRNASLILQVKQAELAEFVMKYGEQPLPAQSKEKQAVSSDKVVQEQKTPSWQHPKPTRAELRAELAKLQEDEATARSRMEAGKDDPDLFPDLRMDKSEASRRVVEFIQRYPHILRDSLE